MYVTLRKTYAPAKNHGKSIYEKRKTRGFGPHAFRHIGITVSPRTIPALRLIVQPRSVGLISALSTAPVSTPPMLEDLHIRAVIHELLQCGLHRLRDINIEADQGLAVLRKEFRGSIRRVHADGELAVTI